MTRDLRTLLNLELREECSGPHGMGWNPASAIGEQQLKQTQSGSSSRSGRDREQQLKRTQVASSSCQAGAIGEQHCTAGSGGKQGAAVEADAAIGPGSSS